MARVQDMRASAGARDPMHAGGDLSDYEKNPNIPGWGGWKRTLGDSPVGYVRNPDQFFADNKAQLFKDIGDLSHVQVILNRVLVVIWLRPPFKVLENGQKWYHTDSSIDEDKWQGSAGLVVKMGPLCFRDDPTVTFQRDNDGNPIPEFVIGDWVMFRKGQGTRIRVNGVECMLLDTELAVKMVLPRPDMVF